MFCFSFFLVWFDFMLIQFWVGGGEIAEQLGTLSMEMISQVKLGDYVFAGELMHIWFSGWSMEC